MLTSLSLIPVSLSNDTLSLLVCEVEDLGGVDESVPVNWMRMTEALDLLLLAQMPPMGRRAPMVSTESPSM